MLFAAIPHGPAASFAERAAGVLIQRYEWFIVFGVLLLLIGGGVSLTFRRSIRAHDERTVNHRRVRFDRVIAESDSDHLLWTMHEALAHRGSLEDLAWCLKPALADEQLAKLHAAAREAGLVPTLRRRTHSPFALQRGRAALLLGRLRIPGAEPELGQLLGDRDTDVQRAAAEALACIGTPAATAEFINGLHHANMHPERIVEWLVGPWAFRELALAVGEPAHRTIRPWLLEALGLTGVPEAAGFIAVAIDEPDASEEERIKGARALGRLGNRTFAFQLTRILEEDESWPVRAQAARALTYIGDEESVPVLRAQLSDRAWWVRANSAEALRHLGEPGLEALRDALGDPDRFAADRAYEALMLHQAENPSPLLAEFDVDAIEAELDNGMLLAC